MMRRRWPFLSIAAIAGGAAIAQLPDAAVIDRDRGALASAKQAAAAAQARADAMGATAAAARTQADRTREQLLAVGAQVRAAQADVTTADARIAMIAALRRREQTRLAGQQGGIVRLAAALQIMARRPAALAFVQPRSLADLVHIRALLGVALPAMLTRTAGLRGEIAAAERLRDQAGLAADALRSSRYALARRQLELAHTEADQRTRSAALGDVASDQGERALALAERARDIVDDMQEIGSAEDVRQRLVALPDPLMRPPAPGDPPPVKPAERAEPRYLVPVAGGVAGGYAEVSDAGVSARGITFAADAGAGVVAPAAGRVVYAARFLSYGFVVILDHGGGWSTTLTGLGDIAVKAGDRVAKGAAIGVAPRAQPRITVELRRDGRPVDLAAILGVG